MKKTDVRSLFHLAEMSVERITAGSRMVTVELDQPFNPMQLKRVLDALCIEWGGVEVAGGNAGVIELTIYGLELEDGLGLGLPGD